jgi:hypothetical protein
MLRRALRSRQLLQGGDGTRSHRGQAGRRPAMVLGGPHEVGAARISHRSGAEQLGGAAARCVSKLESRSRARRLWPRARGGGGGRSVLNSACRRRSAWPFSSSRFESSPGRRGRLSFGRGRAAALRGSFEGVVREEGEATDFARGGPYPRAPYEEHDASGSQVPSPPGRHHEGRSRGPTIATGRRDDGSPPANDCASRGDRPELVPPLDQGGGWPHSYFQWPPSILVRRELRPFGRGPSAWRRPRRLSCAGAHGARRPRFFFNSERGLSPPERGKPAPGEGRLSMRRVGGDPPPCAGRAQAREVV